MADIKSGEFLGVGSVKGPDGKQHAVAINVFPESQRGTGEGQRTWDGAPQGTMTNATVAQLANVAGGNTLQLSYKGGKQDVIVDSHTSITTPQPADMSAVAPGKNVILAGAKGTDGTMMVSRITVNN